MRVRFGLAVVLIMALLIPMAVTSGDEGGDSPLLRLLHMIPADASYRVDPIWFGDVDAWHTSWGIMRVSNQDQLALLGRERSAYWMRIMPEHVAPPQVMGLESLMFGDQRAFYGFDFFNVDRFIQAGRIPDEVTVIECNVEDAVIKEHLIAGGYEEQPLEPDGFLYSILDDYETRIDPELPIVGQFGALNRILILNGQMIVARATDLALEVLATTFDQQRSLDEIPFYAAAVAALDDPALADTGELVGAILWEHIVTLDPSLAIDALLEGQTAEEAMAALDEALREQASTGPLPLYNLLAFGTRHAEGATYLILAVVFPTGTDVTAATDVLARRLQNYTSQVAADLSFAERWTFDRALSIEAEGHPVALVVMRVDDPPPTPEGELVNAVTFSWMRLVVMRDLGFLAVDVRDE